MKYTREVLDDILQEGGATVLGEYKLYNQRMRVRFRCSCGVETSKRFEMLNKYRLAYCELCSKKRAIQRGKDACMEKFGFDNPGKDPEIKKKIKETFDTNYGMHPLKTPEIIAKRAKTCLKIYGGHPNQNKEVQAKSEATSYKFRDYMMPSGNIVKVQGYEHIALDELVQKYEEDDILVGRTSIPTIDYYINDTKHVYFPDFMIKSENKIIEIKSEWTIQLKRGNVEEKALATVKAGYKYEIWVYNDKKVKVQTKVY
jgi:hypothetical protein